MERAVIKGLGAGILTADYPVDGDVFIKVEPSQSTTGTVLIGMATNKGPRVSISVGVWLKAEQVQELQVELQRALMAAGPVEEQHAIPQGN